MAQSRNSAERGGERVGVGDRKQRYMKSQFLERGQNNVY